MTSDLIPAIARGAVADFPAAKEVCQSISDARLALGRDLVSQLAKAGIEAKQHDPEADAGRAQYHATTLLIAASQLGRAASILQQAGFAPPLPLTFGRISAIQRFASSLRLTRFDDQTTRVTLIWGRETGRTLLRPNIADIAAANLPPALVPLYPLVRIARLIKERLSGQRRASGETDFLGTPRELIKPLLNLAEVSADDTLMDIGCGEGRVLVHAAQTHGCRAIGVEQIPELAARAREVVAEAGLTDRIEIIEGNAATAPIDRATVLFVFLPSFVLERLLPTLIKERKPGTRILVHEQAALPATLTPDQSEAIFSDTALTVGHLWR